MQVKCPNEYTCEMCGETHHDGWTDEEKKQEYKDNFGGEPDMDDVAVLCDPCYQEFMSRPEVQEGLKAWNAKND